MDFGKIIERAKNICLDPQNEWPKIAEEETDAASLYTGYAMILAAIPAIAMLLSGGIVIAVVTYVIGLAFLYLLSLIVNMLAPSFDGTQSDINALKLVVYSMTPFWLAGIFNLLPAVGLLLSLLGLLYGAYLLYLGLSPLMKNPQEKSIAYTALIVVCYLVLNFVIMRLMVPLLFGGA